jgi:hypothetical protein
MSSQEVTNRYSITNALLMISQDVLSNKTNPHVLLVNLDIIWIRVIYVNWIHMEPFLTAQSIIIDLILVTLVIITIWDWEQLIHIHVLQLYLLLSVLVTMEFWQLLHVHSVKLDIMLAVILVLLENTILLLIVQFIILRLIVVRLVLLTINLSLIVLVIVVLLWDQIV